MMGTMAFKHQKEDVTAAAQKLSRTTCNLRLIPDVNGGLASAQLVGFNLSDVEVKEAWTGIIFKLTFIFCIIIFSTYPPYIGLLDFHSFSAPLLT